MFAKSCDDIPAKNNGSLEVKVRTGQIRSFLWISVELFNNAGMGDVTTTLHFF